MKHAFLFFTLILIPPYCFSDLKVPDPGPTSLIRFDGDQDFSHEIGESGSRGWELDYKRDRPGYALLHLNKPLFLEPGIYRATFLIRRGHYPDNGLLNKTYGLVRIELWDLTDKKLIADRTLQIADFSRPNVYEKRWIEFSMHERQGHVLEPRVYWLGLANGEIASVEFARFADPDLNTLEEKAAVLTERLHDRHIENGFVVSRKRNGSPDEIGDATTYTGWYVASLAWKVQATDDIVTLQRLENGIQQLHNAVKGTDDEPIITRYVDENGFAYPKNPSKDVYTAFFFAYAMAYPHIKNESLRAQMRDDIERIADKFLEDDLTVKKGGQVMMSLAPYFTEYEIKHGIEKLFKRQDSLTKIQDGLKMAKSYLPFTELFPGLKDVIQAIKEENENQLFNLVVPTMNGVADLMVRLRDLLREQYRNDLFPIRYRNQEYPGKKLEELITLALSRFPPQPTGPFYRQERFQRLSDLRVLASNALICLHIVKTAAVITQGPQFEEYYKHNLYQQDALLKTAIDWYGIEEELIRHTGGNPAADRLRKGYLSAISLHSLITQETNPAIRGHYQEIMDRWWKDYRHEDNPMAASFHYVNGRTLKKDQKGLLLKSLDAYDPRQQGFGSRYWKARGEKIATEYGGGHLDGFSREPLPIQLRPRDSFLWQRNARRLKGDRLKFYPGTDYLFVYWFCRATGILDEPQKPATVTIK